MTPDGLIIFQYLALIATMKISQKVKKNAKVGSKNAPKVIFAKVA